ncbi:helix-turn-helix domain-containing protein [Staphylococcus pettenkoferi]|uniref:Helix-turn-helix domain-containing protein n=1 Tax=Staphylococcus pettenkoferi TaxID=170573 RepID=A0ABT4BKP5_9STAP|nr:helix-turn-helix domain-containing protein [Staphylococcus pettenkoferi]ASE35952.1 transcriptional regulator [Staphylococcus pettenkoferi]EHM68816.1 transcriptional regulator, Cro/CI family [Staphylococcus pettenkoferi VCU012]MCY1563924.1 helix-turn-helix domain-containing protein [Staphylococcus pettenkoferi]MCY1571594.1 helix-turn-helix domain-containing protein [Staphylococcus pettenkoferi]MCY1580098.1 helix-turn-helix domain-containing protein [Staphylococcus pettenkoferi]
MNLVGQVLKGRRERLGMTLAELEHQTHIKRQTLRIIEDNNFEALNNANYAEGLITKYANAVNFDAEQLIEAHREEIPNYQNSINASIQAFKQEEKPTYRSKSKEALQLLVVICGIVIITAIIWILAVLIF